MNLTHHGALPAAPQCLYTVLQYSVPQYSVPQSGAWIFVEYVGLPWLLKL